MRSAPMITLATAIALSSTTAHAEGYALTAAQLAPTQQAVGWWLGGAGVATGLTGGYLLLLANVRSDAATNDLQLGAGLGLGALGAAALTVSIILLSTGDPGPCEIHGTAQDGVEAGVQITPFGVLGWF